MEINHLNELLAKASNIAGAIDALIWDNYQ